MTVSDMTLREISAALRRGELSSQELVADLFETIDRTEREVRAFITLTPKEALAEAAAVDRLLAEGAALPALAGIPVALKDNIATKDVRTTNASVMQESFIPPYDAFVWQRLKEARTPLLGKTNMDEFAMGSTTENSAFHPTRNPHDLSRVPGGSSGGSAAAVAAGEALVALGSDTGGSIRQPASFCGVVGMRPTYGRVSRRGVTAFASSFDQVGPFTRTVRDNYLVLQAIDAHDAKDGASVDRGTCDGDPETLNTDLKGLRLGYIREFFDDGLQPAVREALDRALRFFESLGADIVPVSLPSAEPTLSAYYILTSAEASSNLARFDGIHYGYRTKHDETVTDIYLNSRTEAFGFEVKRRILLGNFALSKEFYDHYYDKARRVRTLCIREFDTIFDACDVVLSPVTAQTAWPLGSMPEDPVEIYRNDVFTVPMAMAGLPALALPAGRDENALPVGMQLVGRPFAEETLYRVAAAFEDAHGDLFRTAEVKA